MLKRTKGRFLLTLLVITGLAGTFKNSSLTKQERKLVVSELKESKSEFLKSVKDLSDEQLNFKPSPERWSIQECIYHITLAEKDLWYMLNTTMREPGTPGRSQDVKIADEDILKIGTDRTNKLKSPEALQPSKASWKSANDAISGFKTARADLIKYAKSTTEDMRDHIIPLAFGNVDAYQFLLFMSAHCNRHIGQIEEIKGDPRFPRALSSSAISRNNP
jgi:DinB superfamily